MPSTSKATPASKRSDLIADSARDLKPEAKRTREAAEGRERRDQRSSLRTAEPDGEYSQTRRGSTCRGAAASSSGAGTGVAARANAALVLRTDAAQAQEESLDCADGWQEPMLGLSKPVQLRCKSSRLRQGCEGLHVCR